MPFPRVVAHRGASAELPENTLAAFRRAFEIGCRAVECDVHLTRDGELVVIHDPSVDRTTDGTGDVRDLTLAEIRRLDAGAWKGAPGERVPTLAEVFDVASAHGGSVNVEVKTDEVEYPGIEAKVARLIAERRMAGRAFVSSFNPETVRAFHALQPDTGTGVIVLGVPTEAELAAWAEFADVVGLYVECATLENVRAAKVAGLAVVAWVVNDPGLASSLLGSGLEGVITDDPRALKELLA